MPKDQMLPGVSTTACPPRVVCDAHRAIGAARRRVFLRDGLQFSLLISVDFLFMYWPESRMPFMERHTSLTFLRAMNVAIVGHLWLARALPKWYAKRIAATWCRSEREKFQA